MSPEFAKAVALAQARGDMGPVHPIIGRQIEEAIGDDPAFRAQLDRLYEMTEQAIRRPFFSGGAKA